MESKINSDNYYLTRLQKTNKINFKMLFSKNKVELKPK